MIEERVAYEFEIPLRAGILIFTNSTPCGNYKIKIKIGYNIGVYLRTNILCLILHASYCVAKANA
jgi:hypothetical protein